MRQSAFYSPKGNLRSGLGYAKKTLTGHMQDARTRAKHPHFPPATLRRLRGQYRAQERGEVPRDQELYPLLDEYFTTSDGSVSATSQRAGWDFDEDAAGDRRVDAVISRRDELAEQIRALLTVRSEHQEPGRASFADLAKLVIGRRGDQRERRMVKQRLRRLVTRLRRDGLLPQSRGPDFDASEAAIIREEYLRRFGK